jgi:pimeloyl-ACP methyl ester carboxylesterase
MAHKKIRGHRTWVKLPKGSGEVVLLLHGGLSSSRGMLHNVGSHLKRNFAIAAFDRHGHGRTADIAGPFDYDDMTDETIAVIEEIGRPVHVVGYSDGGIIALKLALKRPDLLRRVVAVGANIHFSGLYRQLTMSTDSPYFHEWSLRFGERSPDGIGHAKEVFEKTMTLFATQPTMAISDLEAITVPTLYMAGDDDVTSYQHLSAMFEATPGAQLAVVPGASHGVLGEYPKVSSAIIRRFLKSSLPVTTAMPMRRRES